MRLIRRWTRKKPTAGARIPTTAPAAKASRMNSDSSMRVRGVVPDAGQRRGRSVEEHAPADEDQALHEALDRAELVRDVEDRHRELAVQPVEECGEGFLRFGVDARRRLVQHEERRPSGE